MRTQTIAPRKTPSGSALSLVQPEPAVPIPVRVASSPQGRDALLSILADGGAEVILSTADGSLHVRAQITFEDSEGRHSVCNGLSVDWSRCTVSAASGEVITLTRTELRLLGALLEGAGKPVCRERLVRCTWPGAELDRRSSGSLQVYIYLLRQRLECIGLGPALETVRGVGYRLRR